MRQANHRYDEDISELLRTAEEYIDFWLQIPTNHVDAPYPLLEGALRRIKQARNDMAVLHQIEANAKREAERAIADELDEEDITCPLSSAEIEALKRNVKRS